MRPRLRVRLFSLVIFFSIGLFSSQLWASPTFLNRQGFPLRLGLSQVGQFHKNDLKTFEVWTQWSNPSSDKLIVKITFTIFDNDSADAQSGEDGKDDPLMTMTETITIPDQVNNWGKYSQLTAIGHKLNQGFDHPQEGAGLELYIDAQIDSVVHAPAQ